jgi:hypothetical protein
MNVSKYIKALIMRGCLNSYCFNALVLVAVLLSMSLSGCKRLRFPFLTSKLADLNQALKVLNTEIQSKPQNEGSYNLRSLVRNDLGDKQGALADAR